MHDFYNIRNEKIIGPVKDIEVKIIWYWENNDHKELEIKSTDFVEFNSNEEHTVSTKLRNCYILMNYYWINVSWLDDDGFHKIESGKAFCNIDY